MEGAERPSRRRRASVHSNRLAQSPILNQLTLERKTTVLIRRLRELRTEPGTGTGQSRILSSRVPRNRVTEPVDAPARTQARHIAAILKAACALHFAYYNFCREHQTLRVTPAMEAGISDHVWTLAELLRAD